MPPIEKKETTEVSVSDEVEKGDGIVRLFALTNTGIKHVSFHKITA